MRTLETDHNDSQPLASLCLNTPQYLNNSSHIRRIEAISLRFSADLTKSGSLTEMSQDGCLNATQTVMAPKGTFLAPYFNRQVQIPLLLVIVSLGMAYIVKKVRRP